MARGKPVQLDTIEFKNQSLALDFFRAMLNRYIPGERVKDHDAVHLAGLFRRHPDYSSKIGSGIDHFGVMPGDYGSQCFCIIRNDGSQEDFSYIRCVNQKRD
jgi:hypothetical protein